MGKQIYFYMDKESEDKFLMYIKENGVLIFEGNNDRPLIIDKLPAPFSGKGWFKVYLYNNAGDLKYQKLSNGRVIIDCMESPVIEFSRTVVREDSKEILKGRLWVETKYYNKNGELIIKDNMIDEWYKKLIKWIKKNVPITELVVNGKVCKEYISESFLSYINLDYVII